MPMNRSLWAANLLLFIVLTLVFVHPTLAAPSKLDAWVNVPYAIQYGFGSYSIGGVTTSTYRVPLIHCFPIGTDQNNLSLRFTSYLGYSHAEFETYLLGPKLEIQQDYVFFLPQLELLIPLESGLVVKPYVALGGGYAFNGHTRFGTLSVSSKDSYDMLYSGGIGVHYERHVDQYLIQMGSKFGWAGEQDYQTNSTDQNFGTLQSGLEARHPSGVRLWGRELDLAGSFIYYRFFPAAEFSMQTEEPLKVENQYEFGLTLGMTKPNKLWFLTDPRIGASYRFGDGMTGFRLNLGFPF